MKIYRLVYSNRRAESQKAARSQVKRQLQRLMKPQPINAWMRCATAHPVPKGCGEVRYLGSSWVEVKAVGDAIAAFPLHPSLQRFDARLRCHRGSVMMGVQEIRAERAER